ncbi:MAG: cobyrinate a,c-diamide synthase [Gammaproteobacteria bacterium]|nr:cobyrinate a,c-diamide synthase [Gammaproteobacteria bacterium]
MQPTLMAHCPALVIAAPSSGEGKTSITAAIARYHRNQGKRVHIFKVGPDFLDPMILESASGNPVDQLDLWMVGENVCRARLYEAAQSADLLLIEGVMGLFDGSPSTADLARCFNLPILLVINASAMGQTFAAIAQGLTHFDEHLNIVGVLANNVSSLYHEKMIKQLFPTDIPWLGAVKFNEDASLPRRHLGLIQAREIGTLEERLDMLAEAIGETELATFTADTIFPKAVLVPEKKLLKHIRIAIANDAAFSFIYADNVRFLRELGADIQFFSPLKDPSCPEADTLWFPGGYPELHLTALSQNTGMHESILNHAYHNKPIYAECGGMLYLSDQITDTHGHPEKMVGLLEGSAVIQSRFTSLGMQYLPLADGILRGHTFHYSSFQCAVAPLTSTIKCRDSSEGEKIYQEKSLYASYLHAWFRSSANWTANVFGHRINQSLPIQ